MTKQEATDEVVAVAREIRQRVMRWTRGDRLEKQYIHIEHQPGFQEDDLIDRLEAALKKLEEAQ